MTLHKLHAGDGYTYLTRQVAASDRGRSPGQSLADYYTASGNPPGHWTGAGAADLGVRGVVEERQMKALFGKGLHPDAEEIVALELATGASAAAAARAAKLGQVFSAYKPLPPRAERVAARIISLAAKLGHSPSAAIKQRIELGERRKERRPVAGYDLVFTSVKSVSLLWGLGPAWMREVVEQAHHSAVADTIAWLERETAFARIGDRGEQQIETRGFIAAAFDHFDSRAGDPDLHTHVAIANKVRTLHDKPDGSAHWLALDARVLHAAAVAASERYNTRIEDQIVRSLGVEFVDRADSVRDAKRVIREVDGVPNSLIRHFSRRREAIESRLDELTLGYRTDHGRDPDTTAQLRLAQQATLETRQGKPAPISLAAKIIDWRDQAAAVVGRDGLDRLGSLPSSSPPSQRSQPPDTDDLAGKVLSELSDRRSSWTRWNVIAEVERQLRPVRFDSPAAREAATGLLVDRALSPDHAVALRDQRSTPPGLDQEVAAAEMVAPGRRSDGTSVRVQHGAGRWTVPWLLDAEQRLLDHAEATTAYALDPDVATELARNFEAGDGSGLDASQRALAVGFASDDRRLVVGIGPAGAGKTTAMRALAHVWQGDHRRLVPLAPTAAAAEILASELGCRAENLHKFHHVHTAPTDVASTAATPVDARDTWFTLRRGDLVLVDEAGMAGTKMLDWLTTHARERGALVRLLGDPAQMSPVEAGGALTLLAQRTPAYELTDLHRFTDPAEAKATLEVRNGDRTGLAFYADRDRVRGGTRAGMTHDAFTAWAHDTGQGLQSLLIADTTSDVRRLNSRARAARVATGDVTPDGVTLHDQTLAGVGDVVVTRRNDRRLTLIRDAFVKNGDHWTVTGHQPDGSLAVRHTTTGARTLLPATYVARDVELGYATTVTRAQGATADTAHALVSARTTREALYVALTRARHRTTVYAATSDTTTEHLDRDPLSAEDVLEAVMARTSAQQPATPLLPAAPRDVAARSSAPASPSLKTPHARSRAAPVPVRTGPVRGF